MFTKFSNQLSLLFALSIFGISFPSMAQTSTTVVLEDNFDTENGGVGVANFSSFTNWNVTDGSVDLIGNGFFDFVPGNGLYLDLDGSTNNAGRLESISSFSFDSGDTVNLSFDILGENTSGPSNNQFTLSLGSLFLQSFSLANIGTNTITIDVTSPVTANLVFDHNGGDGTGLLLDNVELTVTSSVPESSFLSGFLVLIGLAVSSCLKDRISKQSC